MILYCAIGSVDGGVTDTGIKNGNILDMEMRRLKYQGMKRKGVFAKHGQLSHTHTHTTLLNTILAIMVSSH